MERIQFKKLSQFGRMNSIKNILKVNHEKYLDLHLKIFSSNRNQLDLNFEQASRNQEDTFNPENKSNLYFNINKYLETFNKVRTRECKIK